MKKTKTNELKLKLPMTVPVTSDMKRQLDLLKAKGLDVNVMTRDYWQTLIESAKSQSGEADLLETRDVRSRW